MTKAVTNGDVAQWMLDQVLVKQLYQDHAAWKIKKLFGKNFIYDNVNGNPAIEKDVLDKFRELSGDSVVWSRSDRLWRKRTARDKPGRQQS